MTSEDNKHWINQVVVFPDVNISEVQEVLNLFYKNKFVIATQLFPINRGENCNYNIIVYFKISPEDQEKEVAESQNE